MSKTNRRVVLWGSAAAALGAGEAAAQIWPFRRRDEPQPIPAQHSGHDTHNMHEGPAADPALSEQEMAAVHALMHCDMAGQACLTHCLALMAQGDASVAECARNVRDTLAVCEATRTLLQSRSSLAAAQLAVCRDACTACRAACQPHIGHHEQCRACAEACTNAIAAIDALLS
jgi:Cys-rich four helix bundle protein (predicted Tat secretion target)